MMQDKVLIAQQKQEEFIQRGRLVEEQRKTIAFLSIKAAETFELRQTAIENLTCQSRLF